MLSGKAGQADMNAFAGRGRKQVAESDVPTTVQLIDEDLWQVEQKPAAEERWWHRSAGHTDRNERRAPRRLGALVRTYRCSAASWLNPEPSGTRATSPAGIRTGSTPSYPSTFNTSVDASG